MRVHITLADSVKEEDREAVHARIVQAVKLTGVNLARLRRYGVLSGELDDAAHLATLQAMPEIDAVESDGEIRPL